MIGYLSKKEHHPQKSITSPNPQDMAKKLKLDHLRFMVAVGSERDWRKAAISLRVSQTRLTRTMKNLEELLETELFSRTRPQIFLTTAGRLFLEHATMTLDQLDVAVRITTASKEI